MRFADDKHSGLTYRFQLNRQGLAFSLLLELRYPTARSH